MPKLRITHYLNDHGVLSPAAYKQSKGLKYNAPNSEGNPMWSTITISIRFKFADELRRIAEYIEVNAQSQAG